MCIYTVKKQKLKFFKIIFNGVRDSIERPKLDSSGVKDTQKLIKFRHVLLHTGRI